MDFLFVWWVVYYIGSGCLSFRHVSAAVLIGYSVLLWLVLLCHLKKRDELKKYGLFRGRILHFFREKAALLALIALPAVNIFSLEKSVFLSFSGWGALLQRFLLATVSAITEELLFRGVLILFLKQDLKRTDEAAILFSAVLFSAAHIGNGTGGAYSLCQLLCAFMVGICFGAIFLYTGSLFPSMIIHSFINITGELLPYEITPRQGLCFVAAGLLYLWIGIHYIGKTRKERKSKDEALY